MSQPGKTEMTADLDAIRKDGEQEQPQVPAQGTEGGGGDGEKLYGGKFKTVEELEAAFLEAQKAPKEDDRSDNDLTIGDPDEDETRDALAKAGLSLDDFTKEFSETGALSEESYKKLADAGYPKELVDVYVDGLARRAETYESAVTAPAGGKEGYASLVQWAKTNLNAEQKRAFNEAVESGDPSRAALAVQGLVALRGGNGRLLSGKASSGEPAVKPFRSLAEVVAAQRDPRYRRDPAYRKDIEERLRVSEFLK